MTILVLCVYQPKWNRRLQPSIIFHENSVQILHKHGNAFSTWFKGHIHPSTSSLIQLLGILSKTFDHIQNLDANSNNIRVTTACISLQTARVLISKSIAAICHCVQILQALILVINCCFLTWKEWLFVSYVHRSKEDLLFITFKSSNIFFFLHICSFFVKLSQEPGYEWLFIGRCIVTFKCLKAWDQ